MQPVFQYHRNCFASARSNNALPNYSDAPICLDELAYVSRVSFNIFSKLFIPKFGSSRRGRCITAARVTMPKAAMNEDNCSPFRQHDIGPARKMASVKPKAQALCMKRSSEGDLRLGI